MRCKSIIMIQASCQTLVILLKSLTYEQEFYLKHLILSRTLIIFVLLNIYLKSPNELLNQLTLKFLKTFLISHVEATQVINNIFPTTLFYFVDKKPNPINWLDHEWDNFFKAILRDHNSTSLIWNQTCKNELYDYIQSILSNYEYFIEDNSLIQALNLDFDDYKSEAVSQIALGSQNNLYIENQDDVSAEKNSKYFNSAFYCLNYKEIKMEYQTLKRHVFVWQYYLKKLINENGVPNLQHQIEKPKKFWKKLISVLINTNNDYKIILIIKTLTLLYKLYYDSIGVFKEFEYFTNLFSSTKSKDVKNMIIQMFMVTCEIDEKEIKEPNLKNIILLKAPEKIINLIPELISIEYLKESVGFLKYENIVEVHNKHQNQVSFSFIDNKESIIKALDINHFLFDKNFPNYTNYTNIDPSWEKADKNIKTCTIIVRFIKMLMKRFSIVDESNLKINFPIPKIKVISFDVKSFSKILLLLYCENLNLVQETLDLIINYMNDPLTYKYAAHATNLIDLLVYYMVVYKSKNLLKYLEKLYYYNNIFFNFDFLFKNSLLNQDESEFLAQHPSTNKLLARYFPTNIIYFLYSSDFTEFIKLIVDKSVFECNLIWNQDMLKHLINSLHQSFEDKINSSDAINDNNELTYFDEKMKINYEIIEARIPNYLYYLDLYINENNKNFLINNAHIKTFVNCLYNKIISKKAELITSNEVYDKDLIVYIKSYKKLIKR